MKRTETTGPRCYTASAPGSSAAPAARDRAPLPSRMLPAARALTRMGTGAVTFCCNDVVPAHVIRLRLVLEILSVPGRHGSHRVENWSRTRTVQGDATQIRTRWICGRQRTYPDQKPNSVVCMRARRYLHTFPPPPPTPPSAPALQNALARFSVPPCFTFIKDTFYGTLRISLIFFFRPSFVCTTMESADWERLAAELKVSQSGGDGELCLTDRLAVRFRPVKQEHALSFACVSKTRELRLA